MIDYIIYPATGAIIGYFTNWLAIKMLFLPHKQKYVGKYKVPFTPGIIPKGRDRLTKKIASVIEQDILDKETIRNSIFTRENKEKLFVILDNSIENIKRKDYTIYDVIKKVNNGADKKIICNKLCEKVNNISIDEKYEDKICDIMLEKILEITNYIDNRKHTKSNIKNILKDYTNVNIESIKENILEKSISDIIQKDKFSDLKINIFKNVPIICEKICSMIEDEKINSELEKIIKPIIDENLGTIAGFFINSDKVYKSLKSNIAQYVTNENNQINIGVYIFEFISKHQDMKIKAIYDYIKNNYKSIIKEDIISIRNINISEFIQKNITKEYIKKYINDKEIQNRIKGFINKLIRDNIHKILNININIVLKRIDIKKYKADIIKFIDEVVEKNVEKAIDKFSIANIVSDKIDTFSTEDIENIIQSVLKKELNAITILGGVLGALIGFLPILR